jgi:hypothetical protein
VAASYPKPDDQKVNRNKPRFEWTNLPAEPGVDPPPLPEWRLWHPKTVDLWLALWAKPQSVMWDASGSSLFVLATLYDDLVSGRADPAKVSGEIRQIEDRHGLTPKALLQLRWRLPDVDTLPAAEPAPRRRASGTSSKLRDRLTLVASDGAPTYPRSRGAGWFELSDGSKVRGSDRAEAAEAALA